MPGARWTPAQIAALQAAMELGMTTAEMFRNADVQARLGDKRYFAIAHQRRRLEIAALIEAGEPVTPKIIRISKEQHRKIDPFVIKASKPRNKTAEEIAADWNAHADRMNKRSGGATLVLPHIDEQNVWYIQAKAGLKLSWKETLTLNRAKLEKRLEFSEKHWKATEARANELHGELLAARDAFLTDAETRGWKRCKDPDEVLGVRMEYCDDCKELFPAVEKYFQPSKSPERGKVYFILDRCRACRRLHEVDQARQIAYGADPIELKLAERKRHRRILAERAKRVKRHAHKRCLAKIKKARVKPNTMTCSACNLLWIVDENEEYVHRSKKGSSTFKKRCKFCEDELKRNRKRGYSAAPPVKSNAA